MRQLSKPLLVIYTITLLWLLLFKTSIDIPAVFAVHIRSVNLIPFNGFPHGALEMIENVVAFVPLGLLVGVNFKQVSFGKKLASIAALSLAVEITQYIFSIGVTDITDLTTNTLGGLIGLVVYDLSIRRMENDELDQVIILVNASLLVFVLILRFLIFRIRY